MGLSVALLHLTSDSRRPPYIKFNTPISPFRWAAPEDLTTVVGGSRTPLSRKYQLPFQYTWCFIETVSTGRSHALS